MILVTRYDVHTYHIRIVRVWIFVYHLKQREYISERSLAVQVFDVQHYSSTAVESTCNTAVVVSGSGCPVRPVCCCATGCFEGRKMSNLRGSRVCKSSYFQILGKCFTCRRESLRPWENVRSTTVTQYSKHTYVQVQVLQAPHVRTVIVRM